MIFKLCLIGLFATVLGQVNEKGNLDDLISDVFMKPSNEGSRTDVANEKVKK